MFRFILTPSGLFAFVSYNFFLLLSCTWWNPTKYFGKLFWNPCVHIVSRLSIFLSLWMAMLSGEDFTWYALPPFPFIVSLYSAALFCLYNHCFCYLAFFSFFFLSSLLWLFNISRFLSFYSSCCFILLPFILEHCFASPSITFVISHCSAFFLLSSLL